jgi:ketosteroid isomerase-like protein
MELTNMTRFPVWPTLVLTLLCACSTQQTREQAFLAAVDSFYEAVNAGDQAAHAALFTDDAWMLSDDWHISRGEGLKAMIRDRSGWVFRLQDVERLEYGVSGDLGYTVNQYYYTYHPEGTQPEWHRTKNVHVWRRQADGTWRLHVDIWNSTPE